ncbi:MAG: hypothetical protein FJW35_05720 [Acidobacteria bacterium]|nr:hypothetical protein [Acidobacteriota bacterium]
MILHAQVALSLMVVCIRADGTAIVELAGQDPCRGHLLRPIEFSAAQVWYPRIESCHLPDPCVDLSIYKPADLARQSPAPTGTDEVSAFMPDGTGPVLHSAPSITARVPLGQVLFLPRAPAGFFLPIRT